jgi:hypothetical protein
MESPMPESVKKLLADLIEMYGIYGEILLLFTKAEIHPIYLIHFDPLNENRIQEPLEEAAALRLKLPEHFEQIKYDSQDFVIKFESEIYALTHDISYIFEATFKSRQAFEVFKSITKNQNDIKSALTKFHKAILEHAGFFNESERANYNSRLTLLINQLKNGTNKELPLAAKALLAKFLPDLTSVDPNELVKYLNNPAVVAIITRLIQYEPWKTLTNPEAAEKILGNITGPDDKRFLNIFRSRAAINSLNAFNFNKEQHELLFNNNREFIKILFGLINYQSNSSHYIIKRNLIKLYKGNLLVNQVFSISSQKLTN